MAMTLLDFYKLLYKRVDIHVYRESMIQALIDQVNHEFEEAGSSERVPPEIRELLVTADPTRLREALLQDQKVQELIADTPDTPIPADKRALAFEKYIAWAYMADETMVTLFHNNEEKFKEVFGPEKEPVTAVVTDPTTPVPSGPIG